MRLVLRADACPTIGVGHVMRSIALGQAWEDADLGAVELVAAALPPGLRSRAEATGFRVRAIQGVPGSEDDLTALCKLLREEHTAVVLDGYHFSSTYQRDVRASAAGSLVVDDCGDRDGYEADLLLNQNPHASSSLYPLLGEPQLLLGLEFALLRREFLSPRGACTGAGSGERRILVSMGGTDPAKVTPLMVESLVSLAAPGWLVTVVATSANERLSELAALAETSGVELLVDVDDMATLMVTCDAAVVAAGSTLWETLLLGLPTACVIVAANQEPLATTLEGDGLVVNLGWARALEVEALRTALTDLLSNDELRERMRIGGRRRVDGRGASKVAARLHSVSLQRTAPAPEP